MRKIQNLIATVLLAVSLVVGVALPVAAAPGAAGTAKDDVCAGITAGGGSCTSDGSLDDVIGVVINVISVIAGVAAVIMIIVGGMRYITSGGDSSKIAGAKSAITYAIIGLVIVALSQIIVRFVLGKVTG